MFVFTPSNVLYPQKGSKHLENENAAIAQGTWVVQDSGRGLKEHCCFSM